MSKEQSGSASYALLSLKEVFIDLQKHHRIQIDGTIWLA